MMLHVKLGTGPLPHAGRLGYYTSLSLTAVTILTFGLAVSTPPHSGPFCTGGCFDYPFSAVQSRFPRDYLWMYPALLQMVTYVVFMVCILQTASRNRTVFGHLGVAFSLIAAAILALDYFIQLSVIQPSLLRGETEGIALISQYNAHGVFIALEELGYLFMSLSFLFMAFVYERKSKGGKALRLTFFMGFTVAILALVGISLVFGIRREYFFEVAVITVDSLVLMVAGVLQSRIFKGCNLEATDRCAESGLV